MKIFGIGTDIVKVSRINKLIIQTVENKTGAKIRS